MVIWEIILCICTFESLKTLFTLYFPLFAGRIYFQQGGYIWEMLLERSMAQIVFAVRHILQYTLWGIYYNIYCGAYITIYIVRHILQYILWGIYYNIYCGAYIKHQIYCHGSIYFPQLLDSQKIYCFRGKCPHTQSTFTASLSY